MNTETVGERIRACRSDLSQSDFASRLGVHVNTLGKYERDQRLPDAEFLTNLTLTFGIDTTWLLTGQGSMRVGTSGAGHEAGPAVFRTAEELGDGFVLLPRYEVRAAAGGGAAINSEQVVDHLAFKASWVRHTLRRSPAALILIEAMGDSMEPTISHGDLLLVDTSEDRIRDNSVYVLSLNGDLIVKRIQRRLSGEIEVMSDNARYTSDLIPPSQTDQLRVVGLVVWHGGVI